MAQRGLFSDMKIIIAGTRGLQVTAEDVDAEMTLLGWADKATEVVSGHSGNVDMAGEEWAEKNDIPIKSFPADWGKYGRAAGPIRNQEMADYADMLLAIWDGKSDGTRDMVVKMRGLGKRVVVKVLDGSAGAKYIL